MIRLILTAMVVMLPVPIMAAPPLPDAGSLLRDIEKGRAVTLPDKGMALEAPLPPEMTSLGGTRVTVKAFRFAGNHLFDDKTLARVVQPWLNIARADPTDAGHESHQIMPVLKPQHHNQEPDPSHITSRGFHAESDTSEKVTGRQLSFEDLQNAARAVAKYYRDAGWVVRTYLPRQDISTGIVTIQVVEARFGGTRMDGKGLVSRHRIDRIIRKAQPVGQAVRVAAVERGVLLASDLPGMAAKYTLIKGKRDRETDLAVSFVDESRIKGYIRGDNEGARSTGAGRVIGGLDINSPLGIGDQVDLTLLGSRRLTYWKLQYEVPLGVDGWRIGASGSMLKYRLGKEFTTLDLKGSADTVDAHISYPLIRTRTANLYIKADFQHKIFNNKAQGVVTSRYTVDVPEISLSGNYYDNLWGPASTNTRLSFVRGHVNRDGSPDAAAIAATTRIDGNYSRINMALNRQQSIGQSLSAYLAFSGQYASRNLDSSEFMTLGGSGGVRAYPVAEGAGGSGWLLNVELRKLLPHHLTLVPFYDRGFIRVNKDNTFAGANAINHYTLQGAGISLRWEPRPAFGVKAVLARRIGKNPTRQLNGQDQDGSFHLYRIWAVATYRF